jgi:hypothetical protein
MLVLNNDREATLMNKHFLCTIISLATISICLVHAHKKSHAFVVETIQYIPQKVEQIDLPKEENKEVKKEEKKIEPPSRRQKRRTCPL